MRGSLQQLPTQHARVIRRARRAAWGAAALLATLALAPAAYAQSNTLGPDIVQAQSIQDAGNAKIREFVTPLLPKLLSTDQGEVERTRASLVEPLLDSKVSAAFRIAYSSAVVESARGSLGKVANEHQAVNILVVLGEVATRDAAEAIVSQFASKAVAVRYQAAFALGRIFDAQVRQPGVTTMRTDAGVALLESMRQPLANETDGRVLAALMRACISAANASSQQIDIREPALVTLSRGIIANKMVSQSNDALSMPAVEGFIATLGSVRDQIARGGVGLRPETTRAAAEMTGALLAQTSRSVAAGKLPLGPDGPPPLRNRYATMCDAGVTVISQSASALGGAAPAAPKLGDSLRKNTPRDDGAFINDATTLVGALSERPFTIQAPFKMKP